MATQQAYSVSPLLRGQTEERFEAQICDTDIEQSMSDWNDYWFPLNRKFNEMLKESNADLTKWPQSLHWDWEAKLRRVEASEHLKSFSVICDSKTQAVVIVDLSKRCVLSGQKDETLVYIDYIETAPWNRLSIMGLKPEFRGCGLLLIRQSVEYSIDCSFKGRIGLHSLPQSETLCADRIGMTDLGIDQDYQNLRYYEMTPEQSSNFLKRSSM